MVFNIGCSEDIFSLQKACFFRKKKILGKSYKNSVLIMIANNQREKG